MKILDLVELTGMEGRMTNQLSGGQQQRVALARALVIEPSVLLFDEPLSNLDAKLRVSMRTEIRRIQQEVGITAIYVTHDQSSSCVPRRRRLPTRAVCPARWCSAASWARTRTIMSW